MRILSWSLFRDLNVLRDSWLEDLPVCLREVDYPPVWRRLNHPLVGGIPLVVFLLVMIYLIESGADAPAVICLNALACTLTPALILAPSLVLWAVPLGMTLGPVVAREREHNSWDVLRVIPLDLEVLLLGKARGSLWWLRSALGNLRVVQALLAALVGLGVTVAVFNTGVVEALTGAAELKGPLFVLALGGIAYGVLIFLVDRTQALLVMMMATLAVSASTRTARAATSWAMVSGLSLWMAEIALVMGVLTVLPGANARYTVGSLIVMVAMGPVPALLIRLPLAGALAGIALILLARELLLRILWRYTLYAAREL
jgi:hypothetical protein